VLFATIEPTLLNTLLITFVRVGTVATAATGHHARNQSVFHQILPAGVVPKFANVEFHRCLQLSPEYLRKLKLPASALE
jgi:hypothetical protein